MANQLKFIVGILFLNIGYALIMKWKEPLSSLKNMIIYKETLN